MMKKCRETRKRNYQKKYLQKSAEDGKLKFRLRDRRKQKETLKEVEAGLWKLNRTMMDEKREAKVGWEPESRRTKNNPRQSVKTLASNSEHKSKSTLENILGYFMESLILAQDERWRRA